MKVTSSKQAQTFQGKEFFKFEFDNQMTAWLNSEGELCVQSAKNYPLKNGSKNFKLAQQAITNYELKFELMLDSVLDQYCF